MNYNTVFKSNEMSMNDMWIIALTQIKYLPGS